MKLHDIRSLVSFNRPARSVPERLDRHVHSIEDMRVRAARRLPRSVFDYIEGGSEDEVSLRRNRASFEDWEFIPRWGSIDNLTLSSTLLGGPVSMPLLLSPTGGTRLFHPDGELATARGASAAKAVMVVSSDSSFPIDKIAAEAKAGLWYQAFPGADANALKSQIQQAVKAGCKAVCITVGAEYRDAKRASGPAQLAKMAPAALNWNVIDQLRQGLSVPFVLKGIMSSEEADAAIKHGVQGIVVSDYGSLLTKGMAPAIEVLPSIVDAVGGRVPVLVDGSFRRGSDVFKALAFGATAVMIGRPAMWGLAAYGADGVQSVVEMLQTDLGRDLGQCGTPTLKAISRAHVKVHQV